MTLVKYRKKRKFEKTPEPSGKVISREGPLRFVVQKHKATRLHYDFRLEMDGVLKSWAVPKGPSQNPEDKRLAMLVEDHPLEYANFEGIIPKGNYGAGIVMVWDQGVYTPFASTDRKKSEKILLEQLEKGHLTFVLLGQKLKGEFALVKAPKMYEKAWLLIKAEDKYTSERDILKEDRSVISGRSIDQIAISGKEKKEIWIGKPKNVDLGGAKKASMPHDIPPMLAETSEEPFDNANWLFEIKWDGYRAIAEIDNGKTRLYSRNLLSYNSRFSEVVESLNKFRGNAIFDGEIVVLDINGRPNFQMLQDYPNKGGELTYYVFDLLFYEGFDLTNLPLERRKENIRGILPHLPHIRFSDYVLENGRTFFSMATKLKLEGIMAKNAKSKYKAGQRTDEWLKIKTHKTEDVVICGFTRGKGSRRFFGALVLGTYRRGKLVYVGHTGSGFNDESLNDIYKKLEPLVQKESPFNEVPKTNDLVTWVKPKLVCEVSFKEWTNDRKMRFPIFLRLREDKAVNGSRRVFGKELAEDNENEVRVGNQTLTLTNLSKVFWPKDGYAKSDLILYYTEMSSVILPYLKDRPESLNRFPDGIDGESFYQKESGSLGAKWIKRISIRSESREKTTKYLLCQDKASLIFLANLGCIELNPWNSRTSNLENPDYLILDLDPEEASFLKVVEVANVVRGVLEDLEMESYCKTSGKRGLHIYIPTGAKYSYEQARQFSQILSIEIQKKLPKLVSLKKDPRERKGKIYIDYLRNIKGQTAASVYSARPYPGATVSTPLKWNEVTKKLKPGKFTIKTLPKRVEKVGDLFNGVLDGGVNIEKVLERLEKKIT